MVYNNLALLLCRFERAKLQKNPFRMEGVFKKRPIMINSLSSSQKTEISPTPPLLFPFFSIFVP
jgi:hypothetical protein